MLKILQELREELTPGPDGVHPKVLKECADVLAYPLWIVFKTTIITKLKRLQEWSRKWLLQFNKDKCKVIHVGTINPD